MSLPLSIPTCHLKASWGPFPGKLPESWEGALTGMLPTQTEHLHNRQSLNHKPVSLEQLRLHCL